MCAVEITCYTSDAYQVKLLLKLFICIVDTKLFKAVDVKCFKSENKKNQVQV